MYGDLMLVAGLALAVLAVPALLNAWTEGRAPRTGAVLVMLSIGLVALAWRSRPGGYRIEDMPEVVFGVFARIIH